MMPLTTAGTPDIDQQRCKGCGLCVEFCPFGRLALDSELNQAGYHPAIVADRSPYESGVPYPSRPAGLPGGDGLPADGFLAHNVSFWCPRCRYCELICPDAAVRVPGPTDGLEGVAATDGTGQAAAPAGTAGRSLTVVTHTGGVLTVVTHTGVDNAAGRRAPHKGGST